MTSPAPMDKANARLWTAAGTMDIIWGGPSTGKTTYLLDLVETNGVQAPGSGVPHFIAAGGVNTSEFFARVSRMPGTIQEVFSRSVGTPLTLARLILRNGGAEAVGLDPSYSTWSRNQAQEAFTEVARATPTGRDLGRTELRRIYCQYRRRRGGFTDTESQGIATGLTDRYDALKRLCGCLDVDDLVPLAVQALQDSDWLRSLFCLPEQDHLIVDDFHLLSPAEADLVLLIRGSARDGSFTVDPNMPTSGGLIGLIQRLAHFRAGYLNAEDEHLTLSHRHGGPLAQLIDHFAVHEDKNDLLNIGFEATRPEGTVPVIARSGTDPAEIAEFIHDSAQDLFQRGYGWPDLACICLDGTIVDSLKLELDRRGVPYNIPGERSPEPDPVADRTINLLATLLNPRDRKCFSDAVFSGSTEVPAVVIRQVVMRIYDESPAAGVARIQAIDNVARDFSPEDELSQRLMWIADALHTLGDLLNDGDLADLVRQALSSCDQGQETGATSAAQRHLDMAQMFARDRKGPAALRDFLDLRHPDMLLPMARPGKGLTIIPPGYDRTGYWPVGFVIDTAIPGEKEAERNRKVFRAMTCVTDHLIYLVGSDDVDRLADLSEGYLDTFRSAVGQDAAGEPPTPPVEQPDHDPKAESPPRDSWTHDTREESNAPEENTRVVCVLSASDSADPTGTAQEPKEADQQYPSEGGGPADAGTLLVHPPDAGAGDEWHYQGYSKGRGEFPIKVDWPCVVPTLLVLGLIVALTVYTIWRL